MRTCSYYNIRGGGNRTIRSYTMNKIGALLRAGANIFEGLSGQLLNLLQILFMPLLRNRDGHLHSFTKSKSDGGLT